MDKKVLLFTTIGKLNDETNRFVTAAFSSWKKWGFDVVVFGEDFHKDLCNQYNFKLNLNYEKSEFGLPIVRSLFLEAQKYEGYDLYSFINSDIIFHKNFFNALNHIDLDDFMVVGQRMDIFDLPSVNYLEESIEDISNKLSPLKTFLHNPGGVDYFCFTPNFWDLSNMPDFSIAKGRFDHWLMGKALTQGKGPVIDLSKFFLPFHPEPKNRVTGCFNTLYNKGEFKLAYQIFRNNILFANSGLHGQIDMAPFYMTINGIEKRTDIPKNEFGKILKNDILF
jgi:hypothetical protein